MEYDAAELSLATQNYARCNFLGRGGFGSVYKGNVRGCLNVAIKVLSQVLTVDMHTINGCTVRVYGLC